MKLYALQKDSADQDFDAAWSVGGDGREPADFCSQQGAQTLKEKIEAYWRERGQNVMIALHNVGFHPAIRAARYDVRSDMVNGMPRSRPQAAARLQESFIEDFDLEDEDLVFD